MEGMKDYKTTNDVKRVFMQEKAFNQFLAFLYLENLDRAKYGSILIGQTPNSL
jgi:hypothetical protein